MQNKPFFTLKTKNLKSKLNCQNNLLKGPNKAKKVFLENENSSRTQQYAA